MLFLTSSHTCAYAVFAIDLNSKVKYIDISLRIILIIFPRNLQCKNKNLSSWRLLDLTLNFSRHQYKQWQFQAWNLLYFQRFMSFYWWSIKNLNFVMFFAIKTKINKFATLYCAFIICQYFSVGLILTSYVNSLYLWCWVLII